MYKFIKSTFIVSVCTLISRIFGYIRDMIIAEKIGTGLLNDAFISAFRLVNMFRNIFAEGALNLVFVPEFSKELKNYGKKSALELASKVHLILILILTFFCLLSIIFMPYIIWYSTPGFRNNIQVYHLTVSFGRITFPYLFCISLAAFYGGILNSFHKFFPFAIAPVLLNIFIIISLLFFDNFETKAHNLSIATLIGGLLELIWMSFFLFIYCGRLKFLKIEINKKITRMLMNIIPIIISSGINHINTWLSMIMLSFFPGGLSYLYYADRVIQLPLALIGTAIGTVVLPLLIKNSRSIHYREKANDWYNDVTNIVMMFAIPATIALFFLSNNIVHILFERGEFTNISTLYTSRTLQILVWSLPASILIKLFQTKFYTQFNTKIPVIISIICMVVNVIISVVLVNNLQYLGIAIANVVSAWLNIVVLVIFAYKAFQFNIQKFVLYEVTKYLLASISMLFFMYVYEHIITITSPFLFLFFEILCGFFSYAITCYLLKIKVLLVMKSYLKKLNN